MMHEWRFWARKNQLWVDGGPNIQGRIAGRGSGKTRPGAERAHEKAGDPASWWPGHSSRRPAHMAIIGPTMDDVRDSMIDGESGILATQKPWNPCEYQITERRIFWPKTNVIAHIRATAKPRSIRSLNLGWAWCDELAFWSNVDECWANLMFAMRKGRPSELYFGTTPLPTAFIRAFVKRTDILIQGGDSYENRANLDPDWFSKNIVVYEGTRRGDQEIRGIVLDDDVDQLFKQDWIRRIEPHDLPEMERTVIAIDPSGGTPAEKRARAKKGDREPDQAGEVAVSMDYDGRIYVRRDLTPPRGTHSRDWSQKAVEYAISMEAAAIVAERNYGGDMVETCITSAPNWPECDAEMIVVTSLKSKTDRAVPVGQLYENQQIFHVGGPTVFRELESEMTGYDKDTGKSNGRSPNRLDALVHGVLYLVSLRQEGGGTVVGLTEEDVAGLVAAFHGG